VLQKDVTSVRSADVLDCLGGEEPTVVVSGSPCQGFSTVGKNDPNDPRNSLLTAAGELAVRLNPKVFVAENVIGVVSGRYRHHWAALGAVMRSAGYKVSELRFDASDHGAAQTRRRVLLIAWRTDKECVPILRGSAPLTLADAIGDLKAGPDHQPRLLDATSRSGRIARHIGPGQKLCNVRAGGSAVPTWAVPDVFGHTTRDERSVLECLRRLRRIDRLRDYGDADPVTLKAIEAELGKPVLTTVNGLISKGYVRRCGRRYDLTHTFNGKYRRLRWDQPSLTVDTKFGEARYFLHPDQHRGFTVREAARIQGLPDRFVLLGPEREQYRMTGNAVPYPVARRLGKLISNLLT
jgi:DNA (cytosine-5)-methyltransferase 1